jgi:hypothetical protein
MVDMADKDSQLPQLETSTIARPTLVTLTIAAKTSSAVAELDAELRKAAAEHGARIANIHGYFLGHGLRAGNPAQLIPGRRIGTCGSATSLSQCLGRQRGAYRIMGRLPRRLMCCLHAAEFREGSIAKLSCVRDHDEACEQPTPRRTLMPRPLPQGSKRR